jgi:F-type H+-transporting ATPase subunit b
MLIDWFTVVAQAVNFLILVWLLKRFLYQPILKALDAREKRIAAEIAEANARQVKAQAEREEFSRKNEAFEHQAADMKKKVVDEAATEHKRLFEEARKDADALRARQMERLDSEFRMLNAEIARHTQDEAFAIARQVLVDLGSVDIESRIVEVFVRRLHEMNEAEVRQLAAGLDKSPSIVIRSAFELAQERRKVIEQAIGKVFAPAIPQASFETVPELIAGIELLAGGRKIAWSITDYLVSLDKHVAELLKSQGQPEGKSA